MKPRKPLDIMTKGLQSAQEQLGKTIEHYLTDYANDLIWEDECEFITLEKPDLVERLRPSMMVRLQSEGYKGLIPDSTLDALTCNTYILVEGHLFYVELARNKITEITITEEKLKALKKLESKGEAFFKDITKITGHKPRRETVRAFNEENNEPAQVQFSKHAMLALQETEELVQNLGTLAIGISELLQKEPSTKEEKAELKDSYIEQLGRAISDASYKITDPVNRAWASLQAPSTDETEAPTSMAVEAGKLALQMTSAAIDKIPILRRVVNLTKPLHQSIVTGLIAGYFTPVAMYKMFVDYRWYGETAVKMTKAYPTVTDFIRDQRDGILRPWVKLSNHCDAMYKIAQQANLPSAAIHELNVMREEIATLLAKIITSRDPEKSQELLRTHFTRFSQTLSNLTTTYFTADHNLAIPEKKQEEKASALSLPMSLDTSKLDEDGYYSYLSPDKETPVSQNLKAIFNMFRAVELLSQDYASEDPAIQMQAMTHGKKALVHYSKINWAQSDDTANALFDSMLITVAAPIKKIAAASHEIELTHHLRYGSLLGDVRPLFDSLEGIRNERGLSSASNPLGYDKAQEKKLQTKLDEASAKEEKVKQQSEIIAFLVSQFEWYGDNGNDITKPDSAWRKLGYKQNKYSIATSPEKLETRATALLLELVRLKATPLFKTPDDYIAADQLEDKLISHLSLEKQKEFSSTLSKLENKDYLPLQEKLASAITAGDKQEKINQEKSYRAQTLDITRRLRKESEQFQKDKQTKAWPPKELMHVLKILNHEKNELNERLLDVPKYTEALKQQQKLRTEYAIRTLKNEGIIALIEAVKEGQGDPKINIQQKRKLARLLADLGEGTHEENLANAHTITTAFIADSAAIEKFITAAHAIDPDVGHALTIETLLAGYITKPTKEILESKEPEIIQHDVMNMLDRLAPNQVFEILQGMADQEPSAANKKPITLIEKRAALLIKLLNKSSHAEISLDEDTIRVNLELVMAYDARNGFTRATLMNLIVKLYQRSEPQSEISQKIGLFLGRLANADPELAKNIFAYQGANEYHKKRYEQAHNILQETCSAQEAIAARALYYEPLISTLTFNVSSSIKSYDDFLLANKPAVIALHKAINKDKLDDNDIINLYQKDSLALRLLTETFIEKNILPDSKAEKQLSEFYNTLIHCLEKNLQTEPRKTVMTITEILQETRKQLEHGIKHLFSDHAVKNLIWQEDKNTTQIRPIRDTDTPSIQMSKHSLLALQEAEEIGKKVDALLEALQTSKKKYKTIPTHAPQIAKALLGLSQHLAEIATLANESGATAATLEQLDTLKQAMIDLPQKILSSPDNARALLSEQFQQMSQTLTDLSRPYISLNRPAAPNEPELKYAVSVELYLAGAMPSPGHFDAYKPDSYILIKEAGSQWQLIYLNSNKQPYPVDLKDLSKLNKFLSEKDSLQDLTTEDQNTITKHLARRWNPTAQARAEWFPLIEPLRSAMQGSLKLHEFFAQFVEDAKNREIILDPEQEKLIVETLAALKDAKQDKGYYLYNDIETPYSQSLKGLFNLAWGINELSRGSWEHTGAFSRVTAVTQTGEHSLGLMGHYKKIQWPALGGHFGDLSEQLMNAMLIYGKDMASPPLEKLARDSHEIELQNNLRFGVLSEPLRPLFDGLENMFHTRALGTTADPFGYDPAVEEDLQKKLKRAQEEHSEDAAKYTDAIKQHQKMRQDFAIRNLRRDGIIALIEAVKHGKNDKSQNIEQKRRLAIMLADLNLTQMSREDSLNDAHDIATSFAESSKQIMAFINAVAKADTILGHTLAIEATLAGYHPFKNNDPILINENEHASQQDLNNVLDRLEAKQVFDMLKNNKTPIAIFKTLLVGNPLTANNNITLPDNEMTKEELKKLIVTRYKTLENTLRSKERSANKTDDAAWALIQPERELMNKLGLFLGRLTRADTDMARIVFADDNAHSLLKAECLTPETGAKIKTDPALYYESLVNSFNYNYIENKHELENRNVHDFIDANELLIVEIYKVLTPLDTASSNKLIIEKYQNNPLLLMESIEKFIKDKTSAGSDAEKRLSEFASAYILCPDNQTLRYAILDLQKQAQGSKSVQFLELLTPDASITFWQQVRQDLIERPQTELLEGFTNKLATLAEMTKNLSEKEAKDFNDRATQFIAEQQKKLNNIAGELKHSVSKQIAEALPGGGIIIKAKHLISTKNDAHIASYRHTVQEMRAVEESVDKEYAGWMTEIKSLTRTDLQILTEQLKAIDQILTEYLKIRSSESANTFANVGFKSRHQKRVLAEKYQDQFSKLRTAAEAASEPESKGVVPTIGYEELARRSIEIFEAFYREHNAKTLELKDEDKADSKSEPLEYKWNKKQGTLGKAILEIGRRVTSPTLFSSQDVADEKISLIAHIINEIRTRLAKYVGSLSSSNTSKNSTQAKSTTRKPKVFFRTGLPSPDSSSDRSDQKSIAKQKKQEQK